jgi:hypothetical protein
MAAYAGEVYLDPNIRGPFSSVPRRTQVFSNPYGVPGLLDSSTAFRQLVNYDRDLPQFAITTHKPASGERVQIDFDFSVAHGLTLIAGTCESSMPVAMGMCSVLEARTLLHYDMVRDSNDSPQAPSRWGACFKNQGYGTSTNGTAAWVNGQGIYPCCCYVYRIGFGIVGWFWSSMASTNTATFAAWNYQNVNANWWSVWLGNTYWSTSYSGPRSVEPAYLQNIAVQSGDIFCVEWWASMNIRSNSISYPLSTPVHLAGSMSIGGGFDSSSINDDETKESSPTWNTRIPLMSGSVFPIGVPSGLRPSDVSVGF